MSTSEPKYYVTYTYSLLKDIRHAWHTWRERKWLKVHNQAYTLPSFRMMFRLYCAQPEGITLPCDRPVTCYWVSSGTWGAYELPDKIYVCPWFIERVGGIERVVAHELLHLQHSGESTEFATHEEREQYIESLERFTKTKQGPGT